MVGLLIIIALVVLGLLANAFGVDSRDDSTDPRSQHRPVGLS